jgi:site-specific DNA recombinase
VMAASIETSERLALQVKAQDPVLLAGLIGRVMLGSAGLTIRLVPNTLAAMIGLSPLDRNIDLPLDVKLKRCGTAIRLIRGDGKGDSDARDTVNVRLVRMIVKARNWWELIATGALSVTELATREGVKTSYVTRVTRLAFLAPDIVDAITTGNAPSAVNGSTLSAPDGIAISWQDQRRDLSVFA